MSYKKRTGYVTLISVLTVGAITGALAFAQLSRSIDVSISRIATGAYAQAQYNALSCAEIALQAIRDDNSVTGTFSETLTSGDCTYEIIDTGGFTRRIESEGSARDSVARYEIEIDDLAAGIDIASWQQVVDF